MAVLSDRQAVAVGVVALVVGVYAVYKLRQAGSAVVDAVSAGAQAINPLNNENVFAKSAESVVANVTGGKALSLGDWVWQKFNTDYQP